MKRMIARTGTPTKDISVSRVPMSVIRCLEVEAQREHLSTSDIIRRMLLNRYGLLHGSAK